MNSFHVAGVVNAALVLISMMGIFAQVREIWRRKKRIRAGEVGLDTATAGLSLGRFLTSFLAFFSMFLYGLTLEAVNHYLIWPRVVAQALLLTILFEIYSDQKNLSSLLSFCIGLIVTLAATAIAFTDFRITIFKSGVPHLLVAISTILLIQGAWLQIRKIRTSGTTGALSLRMHQLFSLKDASALAFGLTMGLAKGWPVLLFHTFSLIVQIATMWHFRWVRQRTRAAV